MSNNRVTLSEFFASRNKSRFNLGDSNNSPLKSNTKSTNPFTSSTRSTSTSSYLSSTNDFSVTYMDTVRVEGVKDDLIKLADEYNSVITKLFQRLNNVPTVTREWVGNQANYYFNTILPDKTKFLDFSNNLRDIANKLDRDLDKVTGNVVKLVRLEEEARYNDQI